MYKTHHLKENIQTDIIPEVKDFLNPDIVILKSPHALVKNQEKIYLDTLISSSPKLTYSTISGKVISVTPNYVTIQNDFMELSTSSIKIRKSINLNPLKIAFQLKESGFSNLFLIKDLLNNPLNILINAVDDTPYSLNNQLYLKTKSNQILEISEILNNALKPVHFYLTFKNTDNSSIEMYNSFTGSYPFLEYRYLKDEYPLSYKEIMCEKLAINPKETLFINLDELISIYHIIKRKQPPKEKYITMVIENGPTFVINVKLGTNLAEIIKKFKIDITDKSIYINNLLSRIPIKDCNYLIDENVKIIYVINKITLKPTECINCGTCQRICPFNINPLEKKAMEKCRHCGLCTYFCPSKILLERRK